MAASITVPGYASTIVSILVLGGLQLLGLGIMGEYVGRLHLNVNRKPQYSIRQVACAANDQENGVLRVRYNHPEPTAHTRSA
jgi:undecaprenyl-phosphate 4-deoxy-4-formamido-L-arabinose transferase